MNTNSHELLYKDEVYEIINSAIEVLNTLGHGLFEKLYENAILVELRRRNIPLDQQRRFVVSYKNENIGEYIPDLIAYDKIIIEIKTIETITNNERGQVINYLKLTGLKLGLILNFKKSKAGMGKNNLISAN
jgi:GxxExxY protein